MLNLKLNIGENMKYRLKIPDMIPRYLAAYYSNSTFTKNGTECSDSDYTYRVNLPDDTGLRFVKFKSNISYAIPLDWLEPILQCCKCEKELDPKDQSWEWTKKQESICPECSKIEDGPVSAAALSGRINTNYPRESYGTLDHCVKLVEAGETNDRKRTQPVMDQGRMLCEKFIKKVDSGRARSVETYKDCSDFMKILKSLGDES